MTTMTEDPTPEAVQAALAQLERDCDALPAEVVIQRELNANRHQRETLEARRATIQRTTARLANLDAQSAAERKWHDDLTGMRGRLCAELLAFPRRVAGVALGQRQNVELSIVTIDRGIQAHGQWTLESLRLGQMMREIGYAEGPKVDNQVHSTLPWFGSLPEVERRLTDLARQRDDLQRVLADALLDPDALAAKNLATVEAARAQGTLKTRGDGSQYRRFNDGRPDEEVSEPTTTPTS